MDTCFKGEDGLFRLHYYEYDLAIVDWMLPDMEGIKICSAIREAKPDLPLLMLTSRSDTADKIEGLDAGAMDYLAKPCDLDELSARIRALLRRQAKSEDPLRVVGHLEINLASRTCCCENQEIKLSAREFDLLAVLVEHSGQPLEYRQLARFIGMELDEGIRSQIKAQIHNLRKKLEQAQPVTTICYQHPEGYLLVERQRNTQ